MNNSETTKAAFFHHLHDTLILLGVGVEIADLLNQPDKIDESDLDNLRRFNCRLIDATKDKLVNINTIKVIVQGE